MYIINCLEKSYSLINICNQNIIKSNYFYIIIIVMIVIIFIILISFVKLDFGSNKSKERIFYKIFLY